MVVVVVPDGGGVPPEVVVVPPEVVVVPPEVEVLDEVELHDLLPVEWPQSQ